MGIRIARGNIVLVQFLGRVDQRIGRMQRRRQRLEQPRHRVPPGLAAPFLNDCLDRFFRPLLSGKAGPLEIPLLQGATRMG
jgi:hypothetical protein